MYGMAVQMAATAASGGSDASLSSWAAAVAAAALPALAGVLTGVLHRSVPAVRALRLPQALERPLVQVSDAGAASVCFLPCNKIRIHELHRVRPETMEVGFRLLRVAGARTSAGKLTAAAPHDGGAAAAAARQSTGA